MTKRLVILALIIGVGVLLVVRRGSFTGAPEQPIAPGEAFFAGASSGSGASVPAPAGGSSASMAARTGRRVEVLADSSQPVRNLGELQARFGAGASVVEDAAGRPAFIQGVNVSVEGNGAVRQLAASLAPFLGVAAGQLEAEPAFLSTGERNGTFVFQQRIGGYRVRDAELRLQVRRDDEKRAWVTDIQASLQPATAELRDGNLTAVQAAEALQSRVPAGRTSGGFAEPLVVLDASGAPHACWQVVVTEKGQLPRHVYVSRKTGEVIDELPGAVR